MAEPYADALIRTIKQESLAVVLTDTSGAEGVATVQTKHGIPKKKLLKKTFRELTEKGLVKKFVTFELHGGGTATLYLHPEDSRWTETDGAGKRLSITIVPNKRIKF